MLITAEQIHDGHHFLPPGSAIEIDQYGTIIAIHDEATDARYYEGILCPGFVNAHCHMELSHMKGVIPEKTGLIPFLQKVMFERNSFTEEQKHEARHTAFEQMLDKGIVAVGDIANTADTLDLRALGSMHIHSFVEAIGFNEKPQQQFAQSVAVYEAFADQVRKGIHLSESIVPHAPYSVSHTLFKLIDKHQKESLLSIHNQESRAEDEYYMLKKGAVNDLLHGFGINDDFFKPSGKSSLQTYLQWLSPQHSFLFVHNTYTTLNDLQVARALLPDVYWCLCPNANLYIEDKLPNIPMFLSHGAEICIGTDSLSSNHELCILSELYAIKQAYAGLGWEQLLHWGTYNGACALRMQDTIGSLGKGKRPGIVQLTGLDSHEKPQAKRIA